LVSQGLDRARRFSPAAMSTSSGPKEAPGNNPGLHTEIDPATKGYFLQQTVSSTLPLSVSIRCSSRLKHGCVIIGSALAFLFLDNVHSTFFIKKKSYKEATFQYPEA
jgi:hypothetical protein